MNQERPMSHLRFCCASKMCDSGAQITVDAGWRKKTGHWSLLCRNLQNVSPSSTARRLRFGEIFNTDSVANLLLVMTVKNSEN